MHYLPKGYRGGTGVQKAVREPTTVTGLSAKDALMTSTLWSRRETDHLRFFRPLCVMDRVLRQTSGLLTDSLSVPKLISEHNNQWRRNFSGGGWGMGDGRYVRRYPSLQKRCRRVS